MESNTIWEISPDSAWVQKVAPPPPPPKKIPALANSRLGYTRLGEGGMWSKGGETCDCTSVKLTLPLRVSSLGIPSLEGCENLPGSL